MSQRLSHRCGGGLLAEMRKHSGRSEQLRAMFALLLRKGIAGRRMRQVAEKRSY